MKGTEVAVLELLSNLRGFFLSLCLPFFAPFQKERKVSIVSYCVLTAWRCFFLPCLIKMDGVAALLIIGKVALCSPFLSSLTMPAPVIPERVLQPLGKLEHLLCSWGTGCQGRFIGQA